MGIIWRSKMVLLSTLAALVIIVHSAEEDYDSPYRGELRPRILDTGTRRYEQPWRTMKDEPIIQPSTTDPPMEDSSDEPLSRRRTGRKRKRRPEPYSLEELSSHEKFYNEPLRPHIELEDRDQADPPKRRRKKQDRLKWNVDEERPLRRRAQRRKRPTSETWPLLSEFNEYRPNKSPNDSEPKTEEPDVVNIDGYYKPVAEPDFRIESDKYSLPGSSYVKPSENKYDKPFEDNYKQDDPAVYIPVTENGRDTIYSKPLKEEHSVSEFSQEEYVVHDTRKTKEMEILKQKMTEKSSPHLNEFLKSQGKGPIDPLTLKDILKKSNGSSLSEILQQHNLSLTDLLHGKEVALSILKTEDPTVHTHSSLKVIEDKDVSKQIEQASGDDKESSEEKTMPNTETEDVLDTFINNTDTFNEMEETTTQSLPETTTTTTTTTTQKPIVEDTKRPNIRRFPIENRRKQRIRPVINTNTYKSPLNRDIIALNARKYFNNHRRRNVTRTAEWRDVIPVAKKNITITEIKETVEITTATIVPEETTIQDIAPENENVTVVVISEENNAVPYENSDTSPVIEIESAESNNINTTTPKNVVTEKPFIKPTINSTGLRRQAHNNVLKKKRRKLKYSTTEPPQDDILTNLFGVPNLVSSSEFIARTQGPQTSLDDVTILEDTPATEVSVEQQSKPKPSRHSTTKPIVDSVTEESAKIEIEEILNDTKVSAKLSRILMERNMTLSELVEHRERGSSHVHLADIFQNTSKEANSLEPFLSKSLIEPISKETYPLRALLEGKIHDTTTKAAVTEPSAETSGYVNVPGKMDFGNNVNENAENMGIMSLFHNITENMANEYNNDVKQDSEGLSYKTSITVVNAADTNDSNETVREARVVHELKETQDDVVSWNEIFSLMRRNYENRTKYIQEGAIPAETIKKPTLEEDLDGDGLIVLDDLQHINNIEEQIATSKENLDAHTNEKIESPVRPSGIFERIPSHTRSVTLATASVVGLAMVLFLLTYVGYKWRQQRNLANKKNYADERIPTPIFENRKGHKNNSSSRSISPMLTSNIYTLSTVDSQNGKESPEYMWDSLRKPFQ